MLEMMGIIIQSLSLKQKKSSSYMYIIALIVRE